MKKSIISLIVILFIISVISGILAIVFEDNPEYDGSSETTLDIPQNTSSDVPQSSPTPNTESNETQEMLPFDDELVNSLTASQIFVYSITDEAFLYEKGTDKQILPASITKLLTALYALEVMPSDTILTPKDELSLVGEGSSIAYITLAHKLTLEMLIEGMLLPSGNDAAYVVAAGVGRYLSGNANMSGKDAVSLFMKKLNQYAKSIGCQGTHFQVPDGLIYEGHYTTARDLVIISKKAISNKIISKYAKTVSDKVIYASGHVNTWYNTNPLINPESEFFRKTVTGLKTGSLNNAYSLLVTAKIHGNDYIIGIFSAPNKTSRFLDAVSIIDFLEINF